MISKLTNAAINALKIGADPATYQTAAMLYAAATKADIITSRQKNPLKSNIYRVLRPFQYKERIPYAITQLMKKESVVMLVS